MMLFRIKSHLTMNTYVYFIYLGEKKDKYGNNIYLAYSLKNKTIVDMIFHPKMLPSFEKLS